MNQTNDDEKKDGVEVVNSNKMPLYRRTNSFRSKNGCRMEKNTDQTYGILHTISEEQRLKREKKGMGLSLKFSLPIILVFIIIIGVFTYFISKTTSEAVANEILKSGLAEATVLADVGAMIIEKSDRTFYLYGPKGNYEPWPVDLGLISKHNFLKQVGYYIPVFGYENMSAGFKRKQETLYAARTGGLLKQIISYRSMDGVLQDSQTLAAYILTSKQKVIENYTHDLETGFRLDTPELMLLARSENGYEIEQGKEGVLPIVKSDWIDKYADISECTIGGRKVIFGTRETPCVVYGGVVEFSGVMHVNSDDRGKEIKSLIFDSPVFDSKNKEVGRVIVAIRASQIVKRLNNIYTVFAAGALVAIIISIAISFIVGLRITRPIKLLLADMDAVAGGDLTHATVSHSADEIGLVASEFNRLTKILKVASENEKQALKMESELNMAGEIQFNLLPAELLPIPNTDIFAAYQPAKEVGGDYYDLFQIDDTHYGLIVADVSGKGIPGSMVMATTRTILRFAAKNNISPVDTMIKTNSMVAADIKRGMFVTAFYLVFDSEQQTIECSSAGHNPMVLYRSGGEIELVNPNGIAIGFDKGAIFSKTIKSEHIQLYRGDRVVMYTDGIIEAMSGNRDEYSDRRLYNFIKNNNDLDSHEFVHKLLEDVEAHQGSSVQHDDITVLTFRVL